MDSEGCFLVDILCGLLSCHIGRLVLVITSVVMYKELTMGMYRRKNRLDEKTVIITGGNTGIGLETGRELARRGARVILGCRNKQRGEAAAASIISSTGNKNVVFIQLDLLDLKSVRKFADDVTKKEKKVDILINNAAMAKQAKSSSTLSRDKLDSVTQANHLSHFLLTNLLKKVLVSAGDARVLNVSCQGQVKARLELDNLKRDRPAGNNWEEVYNNSKQMNVLFTRELATRWGGEGVTSYSLHPGLVRSGIFRNLSPALYNLRYFLAILAGKSCVQGAQTSLYLACEPGIDTLSGSLFADCRLVSQEGDDRLAQQLWDKSEELVKLK